jgi:hypothetical protein
VDGPTSPRRAIGLVCEELIQDRQNDSHAVTRLAGSPTDASPGRTDQSAALLELESIATALRPYLNGAILDLASNGQEPRAPDSLVMGSERERLTEFVAKVDDAPSSSDQIPGAVSLTDGLRGTVAGNPLAQADAATDLVRLRATLLSDVAAESQFRAQGPHIDPTRSSGDAPGGWTQADVARFAGLQGAWSVSAPDEPPLHDPARPSDTQSQSPADPPDPERVKVIELLTGLQAQGHVLTGPGSFLPWADPGAVGLFDSPAELSASRSGVTLDLGGPGDAMTGESRRALTMMSPTQLGAAEQPLETRGESAVTEGETTAELVARLVAAAERLEWAAEHLAPKAPQPLASAPRPFRGRVDT